MRYILLIPALFLAAGPALAANAPDPTSKQQPARPAFHKQSHKTVGNPIAAPSPDPDAGISENGAPNPAVTNGGQLGH